MYTKEDFWRDYPPNDNPFVFPWLKEYHEREIQKIQKAAREAMRKAVQEAARKEASEKEEAKKEAAEAKKKAAIEAAQKEAAQKAAAEAAQKAAAEAAEKEAAQKEAARAKQEAREATKKAKLESRIEMAKTLRSMGMELSLISKATGFSHEEILAFNSEDEPKES